MKREDILGPWKLVFMEATSGEDKALYPFGETPSGMILYDASGYMSYTAMRPERPRFASGDPAGGTLEEVRAAFEGFDAYCGTYELDLEAGVVTHHIETSRFPNWEGSDQVRHFKISGNRLVIHTDPMYFEGSEWVLRVVFERPEGMKSI
jgi:hypothetical protein